MAVPSALLWECVKKHNSFMRKSTNMPTMSAEEGNLSGLHSAKFSGIAHTKLLGLATQKTGAKETVVLAIRNPKSSRASRPKTRLIKTGIKKNAKKGLAQVEQKLAQGHYRPDLIPLAKAKYEKIRMSFKKKKATPHSRRAPAAK
mmetsp:Transcript_94446/g.185229  ORF Transcript_94446/g.185229 Transcript_94446/m.185229 type:complete len:145 (-) Transcript_94446:107-541(-)